MSLIFSNILPVTTYGNHHAKKEEIGPQPEKSNSKRQKKSREQEFLQGIIEMSFTKQGTTTGVCQGIASFYVMHAFVQAVNN